MPRTPPNVKARTAFDAEPSDADRWRAAHAALDQWRAAADAARAVRPLHRDPVLDAHVDFELDAIDAELAALEDHDVPPDEPPPELDGRPDAIPPGWETWQD